MSELSLRRHALTCALLCALASLPACAATPAPYRVRFADLAHGTAVGYDGQRALVIELQPGERIPVNLQFDGEDFELVPAHPSLEFVAKHHCFVRIWRDGIRASFDGEHFDEKPRTPGRFRVGIEAHPGEATRLDVVVVSPRR
jgi:hypothetical protein